MCVGRHLAAVVALLLRSPVLLVSRSANVERLNVGNDGGGLVGVTTSSLVSKRASRGRGSSSHGRLGHSQRLELLFHRAHGPLDRGVFKRYHGVVVLQDVWRSVEQNSLPRRS